MFFSFPAYRKPASHQSSTSGVSAVNRPCSKQKFVYNRPKPDMLQSILSSKANPAYNSRRLWYELNMPECTSDILDGRMLSTTIPDSLLRHTKEMRSKRRIPIKKKESKSVQNTHILDVPILYSLLIHGYNLLHMITH